MADEFVECLPCAARPGSPDLCVSCIRNRTTIGRLQKRIAELEAPRPTLLRCPECHRRHIDKGEFATKPHHTHACQHCGAVWRDTIEPSVGVQFLPGFKNEED